MGLKHQTDRLRQIHQQETACLTPHTQRWWYCFGQDSSGGSQQEKVETLPATLPEWREHSRCDVHVGFCHTAWHRQPASRIAGCFISIRKKGSSPERAAGEPEGTVCKLEMVLKVKQDGKILSRHGARLLVTFSVSDACSVFLSDVCVLLDLLEPRRFQEDLHFLKCFGSSLSLACRGDLFPY